MAQANSVSSPQTLTVQQAAAEIAALINASPRTPWPSEVEAIVAKVAQPKTRLDVHDEALRVDFIRWRQLIAAVDAAYEVTGDVVEPLPADALVRDQADAELERFHTAIAERQAVSLTDIGFLAGLVFREHWPALDLMDPNSSAIMVEGPHCTGGDMQNLTLAALLVAIRDLIGMPPPLEASDAALLDKVRKAIVREEQEGQRYIKGDDSDAQTAVCRDCWDELHAIQKSIPYPPRTAAQMLCHAEIAYHGADKDRDGGLRAYEDDCAEGTAARLIEACVAYFGGVRL